MLKRALSLYMLFTLCFMALLVKIVYINRQNYSLVTENQSTRTLTVGEKRGEIYDCNLLPLTCAGKRFVAAAVPVIPAAEYLLSYMDKKELEEKISKGYPFLLSVDRKINNDYVRTFEVPVRYDKSSLAVHITGYVNSDGKGVSGIEKAYNEYLTHNSGTLSVSFTVDALGRVLAGMEKKIIDRNFSSRAGVVLSIDRNIQEITERAMKNSSIKSGAALVLRAGTGEVAAASSVPAFDPTDVYSAMNKEGSPLVNKILSSYSVGSVFKSVIAAEALEEGISKSFTYDCKGEIKIGDTVFRCFSGKAHGKTDMASALENSCNTYFISLMDKIDTQRLLKLCKRLGFGKGDILAPSFTCEAGILPEINELSLKGEKANFSFGQGAFSATPLQIAKAYHALATGEAVSPVLVRGLTDSDGNMTEISEVKKERVFSEKTVKEMRKMLSLVVERGIADNAKSEVISLAGKTGTAQSGIYKNGREICRTWFAGFFPSDSPEYIVVVLCEDGKGGNSDCAPVFKEICESISEYISH